MIRRPVIRLARSLRRKLLHPVADVRFSDPKRFPDANAGRSFLPVGRSEVMDAVFLPDRVKGVNDVSRRQRKAEVCVESACQRELRAANGEAGRDHILEILLENFAHEINRPLFGPRIEKNGAFAGQQRVVVMGPVSAFDGVIAEATECGVKFAERRSIRHLGKERGQSIVAGAKGVGNHPESTRQFYRRVAHDVWRSLAFCGNSVKTGAKLHRFGVHVIDTGPVRTGLHDRRPIDEVGRGYDFKRGANRNLELELAGAAFQPGRVGEPGRAAVAHRTLAEERSDEAFCLGHGMDTHTKDTIVINPDIQHAIVCNSFLSTGCATRFFNRRGLRSFIPRS